MSFSPAKQKTNFMASLRRTMQYGWFGDISEATQFAQPPTILNGEFVTAINAANTGVVNIVGVNSSDEVVSGDGSVLVTRIHIIKSGVAAATATTGTGFIAQTAVQVTALSISFGTASASGTFTIEKLTGTTAPGGGTVLLTGTLSTAGTANTVLNGTLIATLASLQLAIGDRIGFVYGGTETGLADLCIALAFKRT